MNDTERAMRKLRLNAQYAGGETYRGGVYPALEPGQVIDVNSLYPAVMLAPPVVTRPADTLVQHGDHWDATRFVTDDGGWTWRPVSGVNFPTREKAQAWLDDSPSATACPIHGEGCEAWT